MYFHKQIYTNSASKTRTIIFFLNQIILILLLWTLESSHLRKEHSVASFWKSWEKEHVAIVAGCVCVCGTDKSSCISITYFHYARTHKVLGSLQTNSEKQFLPKQHERSVVKVALCCLKVRKYQKLGCQYNLNSTFLCIFIMIKSLITSSHTLFPLFSLSRASASFKISDGLNKVVVKCLHLSSSAPCH